MVSIEGLCAGYGKQTILHDITFSVPSGALCGVLGPNGSGKSTLLRAFFGIAKVSGGVIKLDGESILGLHPDKLSRLIAVQKISKMASVQLPVRAYVGLGLERPDENALKKILSEFDLAFLSEKPVSELSDGELQRATLAQAAIKSPRLYLLDEPTAHLDLKYKIRMLSDIKTRLEGGASAIAVVHDIGLAKKFCDLIVLLKDGKVFAKNGPAILTSDTTAKLFGLETLNISL